MKSIFTLSSLLRRFTALGLSFCVLASSHVQTIACGGYYDEGDEYYQFTSGQDWKGENSYSFDFSGWTLLGSGAKGTWVSNLQKWAAYFDVPEADVQSLVFETAASDFYLLEENIRKNKKPGDPWKENQLFKFWKKRSSHPSLDYVHFAKSCEEYTVKSPYWWEDAPVPDPDKMHLKMQEAIQKAEAAKDNDLRFRYYFQALRLANYNGFYTETIDLYDRYIAPFNTDNELKIQALNHKFGAIWNLHRQNSADPQYGPAVFIPVLSKLYNECRSCQIMLFDELGMLTAEDFFEGDKLLTGKQERIDLWMLASHGSVSLPYALERIHAIDPLAPEKEVLLADMLTSEQANRGISKHHGWEGEEEIEEGEEGHVSQEIKVLTDLADAKLPNQSKWSLALAYFYYFEKDPEKSRFWMEKSKKQPSTEPGQLKKNIQTLELLLEIDTWTVYTLTESRLIPLLETIKASGNEELWSYCRRKLMDLTEGRGDFHTAYNLIKIDLYHFGGESLWDLQDLEEKYPYRNHSELEAFFWKGDNISLSTILKMKGQALLNLKRFDETLLAWKNLPDDELDYLAADPFTYRLNDCHDCDHREYEGYYPIRKFVEGMNALRKNIIQGTASSADYFRYASGLYNMTHYGNARMAYSFNVETKEAATSVFDIPEPSSRFLGQTEFNYLSNEEARIAWIKAAELSNDKEFKAKCTFLAAKCEHNEFYSFGYPEDETGNNENTPGEIHFRELRENYAHTDFYAEILLECSYFQDYVRAN